MSSVLPPPYQPNAASYPSQQYHHGDQVLNYQASQTPQPAAYPASGGSSGEPDYEGNVVKYGSPYAHDQTWTPIPADAAMTALPKLGFQQQMKQRFARSAGNIFEPPCPSFARQPTSSSVLPYVSSFPPVAIPAKGKDLADGFKPYFPGHVLVPRDISPADWHRFLDDLDVASRLSGVQAAVSVAAPITMHMGLAGHFITKGIQKRMAAKKEPIMWEVMEVWNERFFRQRGVDVEFEEREAPDHGGHGPPMKRRRQRNAMCWVLTVAPYRGDY